MFELASGLTSFVCAIFHCCCIFNVQKNMTSAPFFIVIILFNALHQNLSVFLLSILGHTCCCDQMTDNDKMTEKK